MYQALYRTWRPEKFEDVVGQEAIVKTLVELHGGEVFVESALNEGSTFGFVLPAARPEDGPQADAEVAL